VPVRSTRRRPRPSVDRVATARQPLAQFRVGSPEVRTLLGQSHDMAWETMSDWLRTRKPPLKSGAIVRADRIYQIDAKREMRGVHLYFTKLTGCHFVAAGVKFDQKALADSILSGKPNAYIHLKFGISKTGLLVGMSNLETSVLTSDQSLAFAAWIYSLVTLAVHVMYAAAGERRNGLVNSWHPRSGLNRLILADFP
jgi:hypothetical protein